MWIAWWSSRFVLLSLPEDSSATVLVATPLLSRLVELEHGSTTQAFCLLWVLFRVKYCFVYLVASRINSNTPNENSTENKLAWPENFVTTTQSGNTTKQSTMGHAESSSPRLAPDTCLGAGALKAAQATRITLSNEIISGLYSLCGIQDYS